MGGGAGCQLLLEGEAGGIRERLTYRVCEAFREKIQMQIQY